MSAHSLDQIFSPAFPAEEFTRRRQKTAGQIGPAACALLQAAPREGSAHPGFSQSKVFFYLSGLEIERLAFSA